MPNAQPQAVHSQSVNSRAVNDRTALDELMAKGRTKKRQERWVVLGGLLMQGKQIGRAHV